VAAGQYVLDFVNDSVAALADEAHDFVTSVDDVANPYPFRRVFSYLCHERTIAILRVHRS